MATEAAHTQPVRTADSDSEMEALTLQCVDELSIKEIGRIVGRSQAAVESLLYRARQKARERLSHHAD